jgi:hypothetical protein
MVRRRRPETQARGDRAVLDHDPVHAEQHHRGECLEPVTRHALARHRQQLFLD